MKKIELAKRLTISIEELEKAHVSSFNKKVLTNLAYTEFTGEVDDKDVATAEDLLRSFLHETWPEEPQAHKYVIHSCLALAFLFEKPLHPQEVVQYTVREAGSGIGQSAETFEGQAGNGKWLSGERFGADVSDDELKAWIDEVGAE